MFTLNVGAAKVIAVRIHIQIARLLEGGSCPNEGWTCGVRFAVQVGELKCSFVTPNFLKQLKFHVRADPSFMQSAVE